MSVGEYDRQNALGVLSNNDPDPEAADWAHRARIGAIIRIRRKRKGWTQKYLAAQVGTHQETISQIENGHRWFGSASVMLATFAMCDMPLPWDETPAAELAGVREERDRLREELLHYCCPACAQKAALAAVSVPDGQAEQQQAFGVRQSRPCEVGDES